MSSYARAGGVGTSNRKPQTVILKRELVVALGGKCACCGEGLFEFLTLDHVNGRSGDPIKNWRRQFEELMIAIRLNPERYQLLCMNCNWGKGQFGVCPHKMGEDDRPYTPASHNSDALRVLS